MIRTILLAGAALTMALPAAAADRRIATRLFNADEVILIDGQAGVQASIAFSASWQITPNKRANLLFVKPLSARARTNMTVITDRRTYFFDLVASPTSRPLYMLRFTYPAEPKAEVQQASLPPLNAEEARVAEGEKPVDPATLNFAWTKKGDAKLFPVQLYDDGESTYLSWTAGVSQPAILVRDEKGAEGPVNYAVRGDVIVVEGVPSTILLRSGKSSAQLDFRGSTAKPAAATTATAEKGN
jgi:type IV secretion system protein VirB9